MSVVPYLTITGGRGAEAADFYRKLFEASEGVRMPAEDGKRLMHCELQFAGGALYLSDDFQNNGGAPALASVFVGLGKAVEVDALVTKAKGMGATMIQEPQDMFWGDRFAMFYDPFGHRWQIGAPKG
ncbi:MAG: VOC family protein [Proteobacteria bacterium]|nr:VOC family protein [Pseudomonadota bacterium]